MRLPTDSHDPMATDLDIAQRATMQRITQVAERLGIPDEALEPYRRYAANISL